MLNAKLLKLLKKYLGQKKTNEFCFSRNNWYIIISLISTSNWYKGIDSN